eukprot:CAMPEP_0205942724 /NCGR_PEP_ID=MMETSP1325-20131115/58447_1 /ASSEMBLY_ACC=CAM_ASM_000708 /TAXON_ID=236786 /ORGANISM="Florenciella sp., Strain RCC1007" /LENGTH=62 /DNA_ID=CAMNT_0053313471 /DNA_START=11 /DNA_END=196 /DNA_ORIENTATION=-
MWSQGSTNVLLTDDQASSMAASFSLVMMCFNFIAKCLLAYYGIHFFAILRGPSGGGGGGRGS